MPLPLDREHGVVQTFPRNFHMDDFRLDTLLGGGLLHVFAVTAYAHGSGSINML